MCTRGDNRGIITGGQDGMIKFWNNNLKYQRQIEIMEDIKLKEL